MISNVVTLKAGLALVFVAVCNFCNSPADHKPHLIHGRWATKDEPFDLNVRNISKIVKMLPCIDNLDHKANTFVYCVRLYICHLLIFTEMNNTHSTAATT